MRRSVQSGRYYAARRSERGAVAVLVALALVVLIGLVGLVLDLGKLYVVRSELQNSMDSCALAAARDVTGAVPLSVAVGSGTAAAGLNNALFQKYPVSSSSQGVTVNVLFSDSPTDAFQDQATATTTYGLSKIAYVQCTTQMSGIGNWLIQLINMAPVNGSVASSHTVSAFATATLSPSQSACALPVYVCQTSTNTYTAGQWFASKFGSGDTGQLGSGNFGWANYASSSSASIIKGQLTGAGQCDLPATGQQVGTTGDKAGLADAWNTRFGIYSSSYKDPSSGAPDFTGYAYKSGPDVYSDFLKQRSLYTAYQTDNVFNPYPGFSTGNNTTIEGYQTGADRRLVLVPAVDCSAFGTNGTHQATVSKWLCVLMVDPMGAESGSSSGVVHLEYRSDGNDPTGPCATQGIPGGSTAAGPKVPVLVQ
jgi:hypothetical protein